MATTGSSTSTTSENDEAVLLREWNFERFFPERSSMSAVDARKFEASKDNLAYQEKRKIEDMNNKLKLENRVKNAIFTKNNFDTPQNQKLMADNTKGDSRFSNFVRGFRRENTDFFPSAKRHSAMFPAEQQSSPVKSNSPPKMQRSSAIFQRNRPKGEPILTDFIAKRDNSMGKKSNVEPVKMRQPAANNNLDFLRMRREKTESVIFVSRNSNAQQFNPSAQPQVNSRTQKGGKHFLLQAFGSIFYANRFLKFLFCL